MGGRQAQSGKAQQTSGERGQQEGSGGRMLRKFEYYRLAGKQHAQKEAWVQNQGESGSFKVHMFWSDFDAFARQ